RASTDRHAGHNDSDRLPEFKIKFQTPHIPLQIPNAVTINVDTTSSKTLNFPKLLKQIKFETYFALIERAYYEAGAFGMIFNQKGEVLLCHRTDRNTWNLPGGVIDPNESPWDAAIREVYEETGLKVRLQKLTGVYFKKRPKTAGQETLVFNFLCERISGRIHTTNEAQQIKFFPISKLPKNLKPNQRQRILDYLKNPAKTVYRTQPL
ncbi:NUDIX hydrolase, partial [Candidatus Peregrinibacteria bacterium]|nr:NUDIX hydrolase [Candidatus Peregrinibacteria bacterium]